MSYYDPPPDAPFFAPDESEAPVQPPTSAQKPSSDPPASLPLRKCSVKNCGKELPESHSGKMCDSCRGRHRVYASTKRQKRKMEKMAVGLTLQTGLVATEGEVFDPGHGRSEPQAAHSPPAGPIAGTSLSVVDGGKPIQPDSVETPAGWDAQIDPRLFQSSPSSGPARASSPPSPRHVEDEEIRDHDERFSWPPGADAASTSSSPTRYCSIKGCRQVLPRDHSYKMCQSCRDRYREYGNVKREKWKKNKEAALALLGEARSAEEKRRKDAGLPSLAELPVHERKAWEENLIHRVPQPPPTGASTLPPIRMCTVSHCHVILSGDYEYRRCEQHRVQNRHHSKLKRVRDKEEKSSPGVIGAANADHADDNDDDVQVASREDHVCQIKGCYNFLDPKTPWLMCEVHRKIDQGSRKQHSKPQAENPLSPRANEPSGSVAAPSIPAITAPETMEVILTASSSMQPPSVQSSFPAVPLDGVFHPIGPTTPVADPSNVVAANVAPHSSGSDEQSTSQNDSSIPTAQSQPTDATSDEKSTDPAASKDVHLHPKLRVPYFFHPAYVSYPGHPPMLMSIPSPFAPPAPSGLPPNQFGSSQFVQASSPFVQGGPYAYPYMMPIPPPTQPSPFTNPSSAPSPFASASYPMVPGWYGTPPPASEHQEATEQGVHTITAASAQFAAGSSSATTQHLPSASRPENSYMSTTFTPRPLTFKHASGSSVLNTPSTSSAPDASVRPARSGSSVAPTSAPLPPTFSSLSRTAASRPLEQPRQALSQPSSTPSPTSSSVSTFYNPSVSTAALASADNTLAVIRRGSDPAFAPSPSPTPLRPGIRRRSNPLAMSGSLEIVIYDPTLASRKRRRLEDRDSPESTLGPPSGTPGLSNATPTSVNYMPGSSGANESHGLLSSTSAPTVAETRNAPSAATSMTNEATPAYSTSIPPSPTSAPSEPSVGIPLSAVNPSISDLSQPSGTPNIHSRPTQPTPIAIPDIVAATSTATPTRVCSSARCRRKVRVGALCERCVGKAKHAKQMLRARYRLEPVKIERKISTR